MASILEEVEALEAQEVVLVAQDLASYGRDVEDLGAGSIVPLVRAVAGGQPENNDDGNGNADQPKHYRAHPRRLSPAIFPNKTAVMDRSSARAEDSSVYVRS